MNPETEKMLFSSFSNVQVFNVDDVRTLNDVELKKSSFGRLVDEAIGINPSEEIWDYYMR